jgi:hypothetical protein
MKFNFVKHFPCFKWYQLIVLPPSNHYKSYSWIFQSCHMLFSTFAFHFPWLTECSGAYLSFTFLLIIYIEISMTLSLPRWLLRSTRVSHPSLSSSLTKYLFYKTTSPSQIKDVLYFFCLLTSLAWIFPLLQVLFIENFHACPTYSS